MLEEITLSGFTFRCDCGNSSCKWPGGCFFYSKEKPVNDENVYTIGQCHIVSYNPTEEDKQLVTNFKINNTPLLVARAGSFAQKGLFGVAMLDLSRAMAQDQDYMGTLVCEWAEDLRTTMKYMLEVESKFQKWIKSKSVKILYDVEIMECLFIESANEVGNVAMAKVAAEKKENLEIMIDMFKSLYDRIKETIIKTISLQEKLKISSRFQFNYYMDFQSYPKARLLFTRGVEDCWVDMVMDKRASHYEVDVHQSFVLKLSKIAPKKRLEVLRVLQKEEEEDETV